MAEFNRITQNPAVMGGKPCVRGMRVTVDMIVGMIGQGYSIEYLLAEYPYPEREDIIQALRYETKNWGTASLIGVGVSFTLYICCFLVFRFDLPHLSLLGFNGFIPRWCIGLALISGTIAICGLFMDKARNRSVEALVLVLPELTVMGILAGHW